MKTSPDKYQQDKAILVWFAKGLLTYGMVVQKSNTLQQKPKMYLNQMMTGVVAFNKMLNQSLTPEQANEANEFCDDLFAFVERFLKAEGAERQAVIDAINAVPEGV